MYLKFENTDIGYKDPLIKTINAELQLGDVCLIIGNNGIGKTTLLKSILNQIPLLNGNIFIDNKLHSTLSLNELALYISVVFSKSQTPHHYTTKDLISLGKYIHYPYYFNLNKEDEEKIDTIINDFQLKKYQNHQLTKLSDGNLQKAFIARAFVQNSPIILLDEPTTHLDENNKITILKLLRRIAKQHNKIILFTSHDWRLAKEFSDKIWYIKDKKLSSGIAEDLLLEESELTNPVLFDVDKTFTPPQIEAPNLHKELLYSVLQKNFKKDLSGYRFVYNNDAWEVFHKKIQIKLKNFSEIINFIREIN